jgi:hypothetical protein
MAAKGNSIIVTAQPRGVFVEGTITGTDKPGTVMQLDVSESEDNGRWTYENFDQTDGNQRIMLCLLENWDLGRSTTTAHVTGDRIRMYIPVAGEELNMILLDISGTGDDFAVGDLLIVDNAGGKLIATTGTPEAEPFINLAVVTDPTADTLNRVWYTGY